MANLFTNYAIVKSVTKEARRIKSNTERVAIQIQKEIDYAAEHGRGDVIVDTWDYNLTPGEREAITLNLEAAGYKFKWKHCGYDAERIHIWWWEED
jgi:hypothetical protein